MEIVDTTTQSLIIENIISESEQYLIIVSPYLQINKRLMPKFDDCFARNTKTLILYRENKLKPFELDWFLSYKNVTMLPVKNLHAKCYINEKTALITSMNLYEYSQINNHEIGIKLSFESNSDSRNKLLKLINLILKTDYPKRNLSYFTDYSKFFTLGKVYAEFVGDYEFTTTEPCDPYIYISNTAKSLFQFENNDYKQDGTTLLRVTKLNENQFYTLKNELIKNARKINYPLDIEQFDQLDFIRAWYNYLSKSYGDIEFSLESRNILASNFPIKNINFSINYGFASFDLKDYEPSYLKRVRESKFYDLAVSLKEYQFFWNFNRIHLYPGSKRKFNNLKEKIEYCGNGIQKIIQELKEI